MLFVRGEYSRFFIGRRCKTMNNTNPLQIRIMRLVSEWAKTQNQPIPQRTIVSLLLEEEVPATTIKAAVRTLVMKGYLRKSVTSAAYIQLRSL